MIPRAYITEWRDLAAPWIDEADVEQDLVLSRALVAIFSDPELLGSLRFRGGTCLQKLFLDPPTRYSEDLDLVQVDAGPAGPMIDRLREVLRWLGEPKVARTKQSVKLLYRFETEGPPNITRRVKVEINTREHAAVFPPIHRPLEVASRWFQGAAEIPTYEPDELLGTKLRALYQRNKGRDLFDLWVAHHRLELDPARVVAAFKAYIESQGVRISRAEYLANLEAKFQDRHFREDVRPLLPSNVGFDPAAARTLLEERYLSRI